MRKTSRKIIFFIILFFISIFFIPKISVAQSNQLWMNNSDNQEVFAEDIGMEKQDLRVVIANFVKMALGFLGILVILILLYAGYLWMTAGGDEEKVKKSKKILKNGFIGLVLILASYAIASFIVSFLQRSVNNEDGAGGSGGGSSFSTGGGSGGSSWDSILGNIIEYHYPDRDAVDVPRNTSITISFFDEIDINSLKNSDGSINTDAIKIYETVSDDNFEEGQENALTDVDVAISFDNHNIRLKPKTILGSAENNVKYTVYLSDKIKKLNGDSVFSSGAFYYWNFTVGTFLDLTPPHVLKVQPIDPEGGCLDGCQPRNKIIQVVFSEPVDPISVSGRTVDNFTNLYLNNDEVNGVWYTSNKYRTAVFIPDAICDGVDKNSCGDTIYCLPASTDFDAEVRSATLLSSDNFEADFPFDGVVDLASNALDGNNNSVPDGREADTFHWSFSTNDEIRVIPPRIILLQPSINAEDVTLDNDIKVSFSSPLLSLSVRRSLGVFEALYSSKTGHIKSKKKWKGASVLSLDNDDLNTLLFHHYKDFRKAKDDSEYSYIYIPEVFSTLKDDCQNCYKPASGPGCTTGDWQNGPWNEGNIHGEFPNCDRTEN